MHFSLVYLGFALIFLIAIAAFFSAAETSTMSVNRYRLRHLVRHKHPAAKRVQHLLERPDRLLSVILIGNTFATILASAIATLIAQRFGGETGVIVATVLLTLIMLIFSEITPKTLAAIYSQRIAFWVSLPLILLLKCFYPFVWLANVVTTGVLSLFSIKIQKHGVEHLSVEELRTILRDAGEKIPRAHQEMLIKILDLEQVTVEDIMIPRQEIVGLDLQDEWDVILEKLINSQYTRLVVYNGSLDKMNGILHMRDMIHLIAQEQLTRESLLSALQEPYFVLEGTPLHKQLLNFRQAKCRTGLVVNEYGDILGLITLEDILEEIVGEFTTDVASLTSQDIHAQADGSYLVAGSATIRELNRLMGLELSTSGPKTLSGLIIEYLETIPQPGTSLLLAEYPIEIIQVKDNIVKTARIWPKKISDKRG